MELTIMSMELKGGANIDVEEVGVEIRVLKVELRELELKLKVDIMELTLFHCLC